MMGVKNDVVERIVKIKDLLVRMGGDSSRMNSPMEVLDEAFRRLSEQDEDGIDLATLPMSADRPETAAIERCMIRTALKEHGGNFKASIVALQERLTKDDRAAGYTSAAAAARARRKYPAIFSQ